MHKILLIDDEKKILQSLSSILRDEGFLVLTAPDGRQGMDLFEKERPEVVLLDIWMPEEDGLEVLGKMKARRKDAIVIAISGHGTISTAVEAVKRGAFDFLEKPLSAERVLEAIARALGEKKDEEKREPFGLERGNDVVRQRTIGRSVVLYGVGLHTGIKTGMILLPMPPGSGILFEYVPYGERIPAFVDCAYSIGYATSLRGKACVIRTVEHLLAVFHMFGITNILVKVTEEIPILDGSAREFCRKIEEAGVVEQEEGVEPVKIQGRVELDGLDGGRYLFAEPSDSFEIDYLLDQRGPIRLQRYHFRGGLEDFVRDIAPSRTFGFIKDFERLSKLGLASGGRIDNVIILNENGVINTELRFEDEFVRHKILDLIGDLYLLMRPVIGRIHARGTGHMENLSLVREIKRRLLP
jgi:UDP-3-O-[3-hydroxymyristoyl] N-acetylglucosamine deacetylase